MFNLTKSFFPNLKNLLEKECLHIRTYQTNKQKNKQLPYRMKCQCQLGTKCVVKCQNKYKLCIESMRNKQN